MFCSRCELCGKILVRRRDLERHLKSRHTSSINDIDRTGTTKIENVTDEDDDDEDEDDDDEDIVLVD